MTTELGAPFAGTKQWYSGAGDDLNNTMSRSVTLPAGAASLSFQARWNIEDCGVDPCDYAYVEVNDGTGFKAIAGNITKATEGNGIDGYQAAWTPATFDLSGYAGKTIGLRVRYSTDGAAQGQNPDVPSGIFVDDIVLTAGGTTLLTDGAETGPNGWTLVGFSSVGASSSQDFQQHYIASNREYVSFDKYLQTGPYNFGFPNKPDFVEHFPYQDGLLISYWDTSQGDNNTSQHPGEGLILPIDAHPRTVYKLDGQPWRPRIQMYDATFGLQKVDSFTLHDPVTGQASYLRGQNGNPLFDDSNPNRYFKTDQPTAGVKVAGTRHHHPGAGREGHLGEDPDRHPGGHPVTTGTHPSMTTAAGRRTSPPARRPVRSAPGGPAVMQRAGPRVMGGSSGVRTAGAVPGAGVE